MAKVEIDEGSGFCFGVVTAINKAEEELAKGGTLYCLGDIVHNSREVERLKAMGLITINHEEFNHLHDAKVLLRAHGEPPETYMTAKRNNIEIIDATCPVVLRLQKKIKQEYTQEDNEEKQIVIYGKNGHAEQGKQSLSKSWRKPKFWTSARAFVSIHKPPNRWMSSRR